jgi:tetratricopeptide (TPR) repeat protein
VLQRHAIIIVFVLCIAGFKAFGQNLDKISAIKKSLAQAYGKEKFNLLNDLAWEYRTSYPDSTIYFANKAYLLGQQLKLKNSLARSLNFIGVANNYRGNNLNAYEFYIQAQVKAEEQYDSIQLGHAYNNLGRLFLEQGLLDKSSQYFNQALYIFGKIKDLSGMAYVLQSRAMLYKIKKDFRNAEKNLKNAYSIRLKLEDTRDVIAAMLQLGKLYLENQLNDEALHYFLLAETTERNINDSIILAEIKTLIAECLMNQNKLAEAEKMALEGLENIKSSQNVRILPEAYLTIGKIQLKKQDLSMAKHYFALCLTASNL